MTTWLVTGASGFIGRHLLDLLVPTGDAVVATHRGAAPARPGVVWVDVGDVSGATDWSGALRAAGGVDVVVHLAALAHHRPGTPEAPGAAAYLAVNAEGTRALARQAAAAAVERVVLMSSIGAVTSQSEAPVTEETLPEPDTDYGRSKLRAELEVGAILGEGIPDWCVLRPPLVYGPGNPGNMARLLDAVERGVPLPLGGIENARSVLYVGNLTAAVAACGRHPAASRRVYNVADAAPLSTSGLVRLIGEISGRLARIVSVPEGLLRFAGSAGSALGRAFGRSLPVDEYVVERLTGSLVVDTGRIERELGWRPPFTTRDGLAETFAAGGV